MMQPWTLVVAFLILAVLQILTLIAIMELIQHAKESTAVIEKLAMGIEVMLNREFLQERAKK
jgi:hypothetical protein